MCFIEKLIHVIKIKPFWGCSTGSLCKTCIIEYPGGPLRFTPLIEEARAPAEYDDSRSRIQKKTLPPIGKCRIIIQIDILYGIGQNMLFCIVLYGKPGLKAVPSAFHHKNKIVVILEIYLISRA